MAAAHLGQRLAVKCSRDSVEASAEAVADTTHGRYGSNCNERRNQSVLDSGCTIFVVNNFADKFRYNHSRFLFLSHVSRKSDVAFLDSYEIMNG